MTDLETANFFRDRSVQDDPYAYFDALRAKSPVWQEPHYGVFMVTGHDEALAVYNNSADFSSCNAVSGPFMPFPEPFEGDDVTDLIERYRDQLPFSDQLPAFDPPRHTAHRALMMRLLTPGRLRANEEFMERLADRQLDELVEKGRCEFISAYATPFTLLVIADLEGVPESDHELFADRLTKLPEDLEHKPLEFLYEQFTAYIEDRRRAPRDDIMTAMATATFPDGSTPEVNDVALLAANLFAGGQETTVRLLSFALRILGERPDIQEQLRERSRPHPELHRGDAAVREPAAGPVPDGQGDDDGRRRSDPRGEHDDAPAGSGQPRPAPVREPGRVRPRPRQRPLPRGLRSRHPPLRRRPPRPRRGSGHDQPAPRPHLEHHDLRRRARPGRRPPLHVPPDLLPAGSRRASTSSSRRRA